MAFSGLHVVFGYAGGRGVIDSRRNLSAQALLRIVSSETLPTAGTSTATAPAKDSYQGEPIARVTVSADSWIAFGTAPNASTGARDFIPALETRDYVLKEGDKIAWVVA